MARHRLPRGVAGACPGGAGSLRRRPSGQRDPAPPGRRRDLGRSRDHQQSSALDDLFAEAGLEHDPELLDAYYEFWEPHTLTDPEVGPLWEALRADGVRVGVLSNTIWPRAWHRGFFERDGVLDLLDGDVYTSEVPWTKPAEEAFHAAMDAVKVSNPSRCVYVGDRLFDDVYGAQKAGLRAIHIPHSNIPSSQVGHSEGLPDAVAERLSDIHHIVRSWE
ncbi:HAD family hydrolase [Nocardioides sp. NPDC057767]|uniref:HAD family hydrolase n=1 Tax=unclassified Nocardioides TaxID=2615069 RepID=UPI00367119AC